MSSYLTVPVSGGGAFLQVHALQNGIFSVLLFNGQHCLLTALFPLPRSRFLGAALFLRGVIGEKVQLLGSLLPGQGDLRDDMIGGQIQPPDKKIGVYDAVVKRGDGTDDGLGGGGMPAQIGGAVGVLGNPAAIAVDGEPR